MHSIFRRLSVLAASALTLAVVADAPAAHATTFRDIVADGTSNIEWTRIPSPRIARRDAIVAMSPIPSADFGNIRTNLSPQKGRGNPGIAIFD